LSALKETYSTIHRQQVTCTLFCDNLSVIKRLKHIQHHGPKIEWTDSGVLIAIKKHKPPVGKFCHVRGHQQPSSDNSIPEKLNIIVGKHANKEIQGKLVDNPMEYVIQIKGGKSSLYSITQIISYCQETISIAYLQGKFKDAFDMIDWGLYKIIVRKFKNYMPVIKMISGLTPTRQRLHKLYQVMLSKCPLCKVETEGIIHILYCTENTENIQCKMSQIIKKLQRFGSISQITKDIVYKIRNQDNDKNNNNTHPEQIGWNKFLQGKIALSLSTEIEVHMKNPDFHQNIWSNWFKH
jgi:hypothetical protein